jgi:uncharacterized protein YjdB
METIAKITVLTITGSMGLLIRQNSVTGTTAIQRKLRALHYRQFNIVRKNAIYQFVPRQQYAQNSQEERNALFLSCTEKV